MLPTADDFRQQLDALFHIATQQKQPFVMVEAGDLHRVVGGYPNMGNHRMPLCCRVMRSELHMGDVIVCEPPKGQGASLTIRYVLPRPLVEE